MSFAQFQDRFNTIRSNKVFELFVISVIIASALLIGVKTYPLSDTLHTVTVVLDYFITIFFVVEISIRFIGEPNKKRFFHNIWNIFDSLIVVVSPVSYTHLTLPTTSRV